ncbi:MAG: sigma-70 family RNA polymerase sigma factor [Deltaproteobacteria bacterium]|nr:sigma-70 family RNA polymerase sigma factor [Deltaproteobacteria bacterium]
MADNKTPPSADGLLDPEVWVDRYGDALYQFALYRVQIPDVAEDLVQETFLAALKARHNFKGKSTEKTWLIGILKNKILDYFRKKDREKPSDIIEQQADKAASLYNEKGGWQIGPAKWSVNPEAIFEQQEFMNVMHGCLSALPRRLARLFVLREFEGMSTEEICKALEITATNSWVMLHRARASLRLCLEENWFVPHQDV